MLSSIVLLLTLIGHDTVLIWYRISLYQYILWYHDSNSNSQFSVRFYSSLGLFSQMNTMRPVPRQMLFIWTFKI